MSNYKRRLQNPKTGKEQMALCVDDYFGLYSYGFCFKKNGEDARDDTKVEECDVYKYNELKL